MTQLTALLYYVGLITALLPRNVDAGRKKKSREDTVELDVEEQLKMNSKSRRLQRRQLKKQNCLAPLESAHSYRNSPSASQMGEEFFYPHAGLSAVAIGDGPRVAQTEISGKTLFTFDHDKDGILGNINSLAQLLTIASNVNKETTEEVLYTRENRRVLNLQPNELAEVDPMPHVLDVEVDPMAHVLDAEVDPTTHVLDAEEENRSFLSKIPNFRWMEDDDEDADNSHNPNIEDTLLEFVRPITLSPAEAGVTLENITQFRQFEWPPSFTNSDGPIPQSTLFENLHRAITVEGNTNKPVMTEYKIDNKTKEHHNKVWSDFNTDPYNASMESNLSLLTVIPMDQLFLFTRQENIKLKLTAHPLLAQLNQIVSRCEDYALQNRMPNIANGLQRGCLYMQEHYLRSYREGWISEARNYFIRGAKIAWKSNFNDLISCECYKPAETAEMLRQMLATVTNSSDDATKIDSSFFINELEKLVKIYRIHKDQCMEVAQESQAKKIIEILNKIISNLRAKDHLMSAGGLPALEAEILNLHTKILVSPAEMVNRKGLSLLDQAAEWLVKIIYVLHLNDGHKRETEQPSIFGKMTQLISTVLDYTDTMADKDVAAIDASVGTQLLKQNSTVCLGVILIKILAACKGHQRTTTDANSQSANISNYMPQSDYEKCVFEFASEYRSSFLKSESELAKNYALNKYAEAAVANLHYLYNMGWKLIPADNDNDTSYLTSAKHLIDIAKVGGFIQSLPIKGEMYLQTEKLLERSSEPKKHKEQFIELSTNMKACLDECIKKGTADQLISNLIYLSRNLGLLVCQQFTKVRNHITVLNTYNKMKDFPDHIKLLFNTIDEIKIPESQSDIKFHPCIFTIRNVLFAIKLSSFLQTRDDTNPEQFTERIQSLNDHIERLRKEIPDENIIAETIKTCEMVHFLFRDVILHTSKCYFDLLENNKTSFEEFQNFIQKGIPDLAQIDPKISQILFLLDDFNREDVGKLIFTSSLLGLRSPTVDPSNCLPLLMF